MNLDKHLHIIDSLVILLFNTYINGLARPVNKITSAVQQDGVVDQGSCFTEWMHFYNMFQACDDSDEQGHWLNYQILVKSLIYASNQASKRVSKTHYTLGYCSIIALCYVQLCIRMQCARGVCTLENSSWSFMYSSWSFMYHYFS